MWHPGAFTLDWMRRGGRLCQAVTVHSATTGGGVLVRKHNPCSLRFDLFRQGRIGVNGQGSMRGGSQ